jgi:hypothetical protein
VRGVEFLNFNVGGHYTHITGLGGGVLQPAAWNATPLIYWTIGYQTLKIYRLPSSGAV